MGHRSEKLKNVQLFLVIIFLRSFWCDESLTMKESSLVTVFTVDYLDSVLFPCHGVSNVVQNWLHENTVLFIDHVSVSDQFQNTLFLFANYSLLIKPTSLHHEGTYRCVCGLFTDMTYQLKLQDLEIKNAES